LFLIDVAPTSIARPPRAPQRRHNTAWGVSPACAPGLLQPATSSEAPIGRHHRARGVSPMASARPFPAPIRGEFLPDVIAVLVAGEFVLSIGRWPLVRKAYGNKPSSPQVSLSYLTFLDERPECSDCRATSSPHEPRPRVGRSLLGSNCIDASNPPEPAPPMDPTIRRRVLPDPWIGCARLRVPFAHIARADPQKCRHVVISLQQRELRMTTF
jgi:hypothetical protein